MSRSGLCTAEVSKQGKVGGARQKDSRQRVKRVMLGCLDVAIALRRLQRMLVELDGATSSRRLTALLLPP